MRASDAWYYLYLSRRDPEHKPEDRPLHAARQRFRCKDGHVHVSKGLKDRCDESEWG